MAKTNFDDQFSQLAETRKRSVPAPDTTTAAAVRATMSNVVGNPFETPSVASPAPAAAAEVPPIQQPAVVAEPAQAPEDKKQIMAAEPAPALNTEAKEDNNVPKTTAAVEGIDQAHKKIGFYISKDVIKKLRREAVERDAKSVSALLEEIVREYFNMN